MNRKKHLFAAGAAFGLGLTAAAADTPPNILFIMCDQLAARATMGFAASPNIDRLLERSLRFSRAYTVCPLCMPARAAMWSGRYPHETNVVSNLEPPKDAATLFTTVGEVFTKAGYQTVHFGKMHDAGSLRGFNLVSPPVKKPFKHDLPVNYDSFEDVDTTEKMTGFLRNSKKSKTPFLAVADLNNPHNICQFVGENENLPLPGLDDLPPLPDNFRCDDWQTRPLPVRYICCTSPRQRQAAHWTPERYRFYLAAYRQYIGMVDKQIGEILTALRESGKADNTIVVFTADHGENMAAFGLVTKHISFYENTVNIPMAVYDPAKPERRGVNHDRLVSNLDIFPTLCELAGIEPPPELPGSSILQGQGAGYVVSEWVSEYFNTISPGRMLADKTHKYVHFLEGNGEELYDLANDPGEKHNLAPLPEFKETLQKYRGLLKEHTVKTKDPYFSLPVIVDPKYRSHKEGLANHVGSDSVTEGRELFPGRSKDNLLKFYSK